MSEMTVTLMRTSSKVRLPNNATLQARLKAEAQRTLEAVACKRLFGKPRILRVCPKGQLVDVVVPDEGQAAHDLMIDLVDVPPARRYLRHAGESGAGATLGPGRWTAGGIRTHSRSPSGR